jgi:ketosteroid isomerase-like protein
MLAEDAVIMVPSQPVQEGKTTCAAFICDVLTNLLALFNRRITYVSAEVRVIGDIAFDRGSFFFTVSPKSGGETTQETGKYLFLYFRAPDGSWRIARAIVNLDERDSEPPASPT